MILFYPTQKFWHSKTDKRIEIQDISYTTHSATVTYTRSDTDRVHEQGYHTLGHQLEEGGWIEVQ